MADFTTDKLISSMLQPQGGRKGGPIIEEIGADKEEIIELNGDGEFELDSNQKQVAPKIEEVAPKAVPEPEGPSLFDEMMAAQAAAKKEKEKQTTKATTKSFGTGFKKGFFGSSSSSKSSGCKQAAKKPAADDVINVTAKKSAGGIGKKQTSESLNNLSNEVRSAMEESTNPAVKELQKGEWMTPDLMQQFAGNPIISRGLRNPKCQKAMELMQSNPEQAKKQFLGDEEVDMFMREFGKVMGAHFDRLGSKQEEQAAASELGPLADAAIKREHERMEKEKKKKTANVGIQEYDKKAAEEEKKVKEIVNNPEIAQMLMDPAMQTILQECGDPAKFQKHMRNPETARKIDLLFKSGLVKTEN
jgi:hypothetical protein